jgi:hypothetical protein
MNRLKLIAILGLLLGSGTAYAQLTGFNGFCEKGATPATVSGLNSTNTLQGVVPGGNAGCLVQVYLTGTTTPAVIKANAGGGTLSNPFRANQNGQWLFFANTGQGYDVVMSGGLAPNAYTTPVTLTDLLVPSGSGGSGTVTNFTAGNLAPLFTTTVNNGSTTPNLAFNLSTAPNLDFFGNVSGSTGAPSYIHFVAGANMTITPSGGNTLTFSSTGGGTGLTGLTGDCLAGDQSTACTVVMVHAFDNTGATPNSRFYIETEVPPAPGATSGSVGLYAENIFNGGGPFGKYALYYDNDDLSEWVSQYIDNSAHTNSYLYGNNSALNIVNDGSPLAGTSQFFFANDYDAIKQRLGIYIDNQNPNSLIQIRSEGTDPTPFLVFGKGTEIIQLEGQEVFTSPISFDPTPVISALKTNIDGGVGTRILKPPASPTLPLWNTTL